MLHRQRDHAARRGNHEPQPDEIAACRPWLEQQIDAIAPKVVITLGNFAARLLLDTKEGITRLRGHDPYGDAVLIPTLHPAYALRGGAGAVRPDRPTFVRAKRALAVAGSPLGQDGTRDHRLHRFGGRDQTAGGGDRRLSGPAT